MYHHEEMASKTLTKLSHVGMQMEGMVTDLQLAREKQQAFETWQRQNSKSSPLDLSVTVLTTGFWPAFKVTIHLTNTTHTCFAAHQSC